MKRGNPTVLINTKNYEKKDNKLSVGPAHQQKPKSTAVIFQQQPKNTPFRERSHQHFLRTT